MVLNCTKRVCLAAAYWLYPNITNHAANSAMCDEELANWTKISKEPFMNGLETITDATWCGNVLFCAIVLMLKNEYLPRQARNKQTNKQENKRRFLQVPVSGRNWNGLRVHQPGATLRHSRDGTAL